MPPRRWKQSVVPLGAWSSDRQTFPAPPPPPSCRGTWFAILSTECYYSPPQEGIFGIARSVRLSLPRRSCLRYRHLVSHCDYRFVTIGPISLAGSTFHISFSSSFRVVHTRRTMPGARRRGRPRTAWTDNIKTRTGLHVEESVRMTEDRYKRRKYSTSTVWPALGSRTAKEQNGTYARERSGVDLARIFGGASARVIRLCVCVCGLSSDNADNEAIPAGDGRRCVAATDDGPCRTLGTIVSRQPMPPPPCPLHLYPRRHAPICRRSCERQTTDAGTQGVLGQNIPAAWPLPFHTI